MTDMGRRSGQRRVSSSGRTTGRSSTSRRVRHSPSASCALQWVAPSPWGWPRQRSEAAWWTWSRSGPRRPRCAPGLTWWRRPGRDAAAVERHLAAARPAHGRRGSIDASGRWRCSRRTRRVPSPTSRRSSVSRTAISTGSSRRDRWSWSAGAGPVAAHAPAARCDRRGHRCAVGGRGGRSRLVRPGTSHPGLPAPHRCHADAVPRSAAGDIHHRGPGRVRRFRTPGPRDAGGEPCKTR